MAEPIVSAREVHVRFHTPRGVVHAVRGADLDLYPGETLALVGESGSGKSALAKAMLHLHQPPFTPNRTEIAGRIALNAPFSAELTEASPRTIRQARARAIGMIFQDALSALNPVQRIGAQVSEALAQSGRVTKDPEAEVLTILEAIGLPDPRAAARAYPHQLSGGQNQRVMIAVAAVRHPAAVIADEPTTALDVTVQAQILRLLKDLQRMRGTAMLFISHDLGVVADIADRVAVMQAGEIVETGPAGDLFAAPQHSYTQMLLASRPGRRGSPAAPRQGAAEAAADPILHARGVGFSYPAGMFSSAPPTRVLRDVSLTVMPGQTHGLVGESGSGKSTFGRLALGLLTPDAGQIEACGVVPHTLRGKRARAFRREVQVIYQDSASALDPRMSLGRSVAEGLEIHGLPRARALVEVRRLFDRVRLPAAFVERFPHEVSGGQRQRACIARAIALRPRLLIADEPVTALDVSVQAQVLELFRELQAELGLAMLFISHDLGVVREVCRTVTVLKAGAVVEAGETARVLARPESAYAKALIASIPGRAWA